MLLHVSSYLIILRVKSCGHCEGIAIALCCHHQCTWTAYTGKNFFKSCSLSVRDFQLISSLSSWGTCTWKGDKYKKTESSKSAGDQKEANKDELPAAEAQLESKVMIDIDEQESVMHEAICTGVVENGGEHVNYTAVNTIGDNNLQVSMGNNR